MAYSLGSSKIIGAPDYGNFDGVTPNTGALTSASGNGGSNYPRLTKADATGTTSATINIAGFVGSAPGQTVFAGTKVYLYTADNVPASNNGTVLNLIKFRTLPPPGGTDCLRGSGRHERGCAAEQRDHCLETQQRSFRGRAQPGRSSLSPVVQVAGRDTKATPTAYVFIDKGIGKQLLGDL